MNVKYEGSKKLNKLGETILNCFDEMQGLSPFMSKLAKEYIQLTANVDYDSFVKTVKSKAALETKLLRIKKYCMLPEDNEIAMKSFIDKYIDVNTVKFSYSIENKKIVFIKKVGFNNKLALDFFGISKDKLSKMNNTGFIEGYVDVVIRKEVEEELLGWKFPDNVKVSIGDVYKNEFCYTNIDIRLVIDSKNLDSETLIDITTFAMSFNEFFEEKYMNKSKK